MVVMMEIVWKRCGNLNAKCFDSLASKLKSSTSSSSVIHILHPITADTWPTNYKSQKSRSWSEKSHVNHSEFLIMNLFSHFYPIRTGLSTGGTYCERMSDSIRACFLSRIHWTVIVSRMIIESFSEFVWDWSGFFSQLEATPNSSGHTMKKSGSLKKTGCILNFTKNQSSVQSPPFKPWRPWITPKREWTEQLMSANCSFMLTNILH